MTDDDKDPNQLELFPDPVLQAWIDWAKTAGVPVKIYVPTFKTEDLMGFITPLSKGPFATPRKLK